MLKLSVFAGLAAAQVSVTSYCQALIQECKTSHGFADQAQCETVMTAVTPGATTDTDTDSLGCRLRFLVDAVENKTATKCQYAGPTGGGKCGTDMVQYACRAATTACAGLTGAAAGSYADQASCETGLATLAAQWGAKQGANAAGEDTLECRTYHALVGGAAGQAGAGNPAVYHCTHFGLTGGPCSAAPVPNAQHYCETVMHHCQGTNMQYSDMTKCMGSVGAFPTTPADARASNAMNSLGCREYHAQAAASDTSVTFPDDVHCEHAGPSGGNACGTFGQGWASLAKFICNDTSVDDFVKGAGTQANLDTIIPKGRPTAYSNQLDTTKNTQVCRIYHLTVAADPAQTVAHCPHGSLTGDGGCGIATNPVDNLCAIIEGVCSVGGTGQFASRGACNSSLNAATTIMKGSFADRTQNTLGCRLYHVSVAASYLPGGTGGDNATLKNLHCSHVTVPAAAGGCTGPAPTAAGAPTAPTNAGAPTAPTNAAAAPTKASASTVSFAFAFLVAVGSSLFAF